MSKSLIVNRVAILLSVVCTMWVIVWTEVKAGEPYSCECPNHKARARGYAPCARVELYDACLIVFSDGKLLDTDTIERVAATNAAISQKFSVPVPVNPLSEKPLLLEQIPPEKWDSGEAKKQITGEILSLAALPLVLDGQDSETVDRAVDLVAKSLPELLGSVDRPELATVDAGSALAGAGCVQVAGEGIEVMINSGWYLQNYEKNGWSCISKK